MRLPSRSVRDRRKFTRTTGRKAVILVQTTVELLVDGKIVRSIGDTIQCETREEGVALWERMHDALVNDGLVLPDQPNEGQS